MDIDIRVNKIHGPAFDDADVKLATFLTYSEHRLADIHGNSSGAHCEGNALYFGARKFMPNKFREVRFFSS